jgi:hypothetical protein
MVLILSDYRMVLLKTTLTGALLLVAGILLLTVAGPYITVQVQAVQRRDVEAHGQFLVGDVVDRPYTLPGGVTAFGTIDVVQAPTNQSAGIHFIVLDSQNYPLWVAGQQSNNLFTSDQQGSSNFTFNTPSAGVYHFVFDNRQSLYKKYVTLTVSYNEVSVNTTPDPRIPYVGWGLLGVGLLVLIYGLARKPRISWA